ncbi:acyl-CoA carboxylase epsilon subunit [Streptomyces sp. NPDC091281]|uniref:acyl-CoA carboxylase epsilon subunit n=1 Tax=Streptomyces sp. NPDC091281 TaxID=3365985 RepID=UPI00382B1B6E
MPATGLLQHPAQTVTDTAAVTVVEETAAEAAVPAPVALLVPPAAGSGAATGYEDLVPTPVPRAPVPPPAAPAGPAGPADEASGAVAGLVRVHRGEPTPEELAAVVAVLLARAAAAGSAASADAAAVRHAPRWRRFDRGHGYRTAHSWQAGRRPRRAVRGTL